MKNTKWKNEELLYYLDEFKSLYQNRPIKNNEGGMKSPHMFPAWFVVKKLKPKFLIESGIWQGLGTWFFEKASPDTKVISIDPCLQYRSYISDSVQYQTEDFLQTDWKSMLEPAETLVFFDDHQNCMPRLKKCKQLGFNRVMWEDNYPLNQGDCYTPKKIFANGRYVIDKAGAKTWFEKNDEDLAFLESSLSLYQEMPPIFSSEKTRWGDDWDDNYPTPDALLKKDDYYKYIEFFNEKLDYTWISYMEI
jgi:hypothetical protein